MINIYFSDTEAVEACICRLNVMWWSTSKSWLDAKILRQLIAKTSAESLSKNDLIRRPPKSTKSKSISRRRLQGDSSYIRHVVGKLKHWHRLKYKLADVSAGKLSTPETWARDTGNWRAPVTGQVANTPTCGLPTRGLISSRASQLAD